MVVSGVDRPVAGVPRDFAIAHEYGHHVANSRRSVEGFPVAGTVRWATYERVCQLSRRGRVVPGAGSAHYWDDPEEAFADAYARLNRSGAGLGWQYARLLRPTPASLAKIHADVTRPYAGPATTSWSGSLSPPSAAGADRGAAGSRSAAVSADAGAPGTATASRASAPAATANRSSAPTVGAARAVAGRSWLVSRTLRTPLDGRVAVSLQARPGVPLVVALRDPAAGRVLARTQTAPPVGRFCQAERDKGAPPGPMSRARSELTTRWGSSYTWR
jgi:hypothetical protein